MSPVGVGANRLLAGSESAGSASGGAATGSSARSGSARAGSARGNSARGSSGGDGSGACGVLGSTDWGVTIVGGVDRSAGSPTRCGSPQLCGVDGDELCGALVGGALAGTALVCGAVPGSGDDGGGESKYCRSAAIDPGGGAIGAVPRGELGGGSSKGAFGSKSLIGIDIGPVGGATREKS